MSSQGGFFEKGAWLQGIGQANEMPPRGVSHLKPVDPVHEWFF